MAAAALLAAACSSSSTGSPSSPGDDGTNDGDGDAGSSSRDAGRTTGSRDAGAADSGATQTYATVPLNFDELAAEADVTSQYAAHVTFSSPSEPIHVEGSSVDFGSSPPNFLCSSSCVDDYDLDFAAPVKGVHFSAVGANDTGTIAKVNVYVSGSLAQTVDIIGQGDTAIPVAVDLSSFSNVTRIEVTNITDEGGIGIDDLSFDFPNAS